MSITQVTATEQRLTQMLRTCSEALTLVTAERDALAIEKSGPYFGHYQQALGEIAVLKGKLDYMTAERDAIDQRNTDLVEFVHDVHKAKGRYHNQLAMCALYEACGLPSVRPISGQKEFGEKHD